MAAERAEFSRIFGDGPPARAIRSPGRVNLIGEHTDYNDGFVCPMAIEPEVRFICRPRSDGAVRVASTLFPDEIVEFPIQGKIERAEPKWANYIRGVAAELIRAGIPLSGMDMLMSNTLPVGGGLSSSAAIEVGTALCFLSLAGLQMDPARLALICQKAEHDYALVPCGIMDQMIVSSAQAGHATLYDCRSGRKQYVRIDEKDLRVVIVNTMVRHELSGGEYARRRGQCETAVAHFRKTDPSVRALRDVTMERLESAKGELDEMVYRRARHVIGENARTVEAAQALSNRHYERTGELMVQSHRSLQTDYEVSCEELDYLVETALNAPGVYGARMTGGGFGGCIVALTQPRSVETLRELVTQRYAEKYKVEPAVIVTTATAAAGEVYKKQAEGK